MRSAGRYSRHYVGHWVLARGDTLTLREAGERFRLTDLVLDTARVAAGNGCRFRGAMVFRAPRTETLAVAWIGRAEQALVYGWPADLGPFGGLGVVRWGDSLRGTLLFEQEVAIQVTPGTTAQLIFRPMTGEPRAGP